MKETSSKNPLIKEPEIGGSSGEQVKPQEGRLIYDDISIPEKYDENKLILLPVNAHTQHFYWEIADETLERSIAARECRVIIRLYYVSDGKRQEVESVYSSSPRGNYYAYHTPNTLEMEAALFVSDKDGERLIINSNRVSTPSSGMHGSPWEIWMTKDGKEKKLESRQSDMIAPDALTNPSSLDLVLSEERLKARIGDMFMGAPSSLPPSSSGFSSWNLSSDANGGRK